MVGPDYKCPLRILLHCGPRPWISKSQPIVFANYPPLIVFADILARPSNLCRCWGPLLGEHLPCYLRGAIFKGDVCQAAKDVEASQEALADLFERIEYFFKRLESYTEVPPTNAMTDVIVKIMVEVLNIFAIATKEMKQGRASELLPRNILYGG